MRPKRLFKLLRGLVVSKLFGAASVSGAAADDIATSVWTTEAELDKEVARIFDNEAGESIDRTLDILRRKGFTCTKTERRTDYDYFCDMQETFFDSPLCNTSTDCYTRKYFAVGIGRKTKGKIG